MSPFNVLARIRSHHSRSNSLQEARPASGTSITTASQGSSSNPATVSVPHAIPAARSTPALAKHTRKRRVESTDDVQAAIHGAANELRSHHTQPKGPNYADKQLGQLG